MSTDPLYEAYKECRGDVTPQNEAEIIKSNWIWAGRPSNFFGATIKDPATGMATVKLFSRNPDGSIKQQIASEL